MDTRTFIEFDTNANQIKVSGVMLPDTLIIELDRNSISSILYGEYRNVYYDKGKYWNDLSQDLASLNMIYALLAERIPYAILAQDVAFVVDGICYDDWREMWLNKIRETYQTRIQFNSRFNILKVNDLLNKSSKTFFIDESIACKLMSMTNEDEAIDIILTAIGRQDRVKSSSKIRLICSAAFDKEDLGIDNDGLRELAHKLYTYYNCNHENIYEPESNYEPVRFQLTEKGKALAESLNKKDDYDDDVEDDDDWYVEDDEDEKEKEPEIKINPNFPRDSMVEGYLKEWQNQNAETVEEAASEDKTE